MSDGCADQLPMQEAFALLGHDIRLDILVALLDNWVAAYTEPIPYAELMEAVGVDDSGKFNYHLGKLRGGYVQQVEDGYVPTAAGTALYRAVVAHQPGREVNRTQFDVDSECPSCEAELVGTHERGFLLVDCNSCDDWVGFAYPFPKNGFNNRSDDEVVRAAHKRCKHHLELARSGQCPFCAATTSIEVLEEALKEGDEPAVTIECTSCSYIIGSQALFFLLLNTTVTAVLSDVGIDVEQYEWELPESTASISSQKPLRVRVDLEGERGDVTLVVDKDLDVCSIRIDN